MGYDKHGKAIEKIAIFLKDHDFKKVKVKVETCDGRKTAITIREECSEAEHSHSHWVSDESCDACDDPYDDPEE